MNVTLWSTSSGLLDCATQLKTKKAEIEMMKKQYGDRIAKLEKENDYLEVPSSILFFPTQSHFCFTYL